MCTGANVLRGGRFFQGAAHPTDKIELGFENGGRELNPNNQNEHPQAVASRT
jgi:hypothetical protein